MIFFILAAALLPVSVLLFYIWHKDSRNPEPAGQLVKGFIYGILSIPISLCISIPLSELGLCGDESTFFGGILSAFLGAAIPEELAKLLMLWLLLKKNPHFDEHMDGILYAVYVSMGFAAVENIMYLFSNYDEWISVGIIRALFSVPGHLGFAILMGYYYSLAHFSNSSCNKYLPLAFIAPILAHGAYDTILFWIGLSLPISGALTMLFLFVCHQLWKYGSLKIAEHLERDKNRETP